MMALGYNKILFEDNGNFEVILNTPCSEISL